MQRIPTICGRLRTRRGETIAELLVAILVSSAGLLLMAGMLSAASNIVKDGRGLFADYVEAENILAAQPSSDAAESSEVVTVSLGSIAVCRVLDSSEMSPSSDLMLTDSSDWGGGGTIPVTYYNNTVLNGKPVISYRQTETG